MGGARKNIHVLQHVPFEGPGSIADWCAARSHTLSFTPLYASELVLPDPDAVDLLVIMGGPMSVYDEPLYPWLEAEKDLITSFLREDKPVLGICLGAQLLAVCSGADVGPATNKEVGWFPVYPTPAAAEAPWLYSLLESRPVLFHWHGDRFAIPAGAVNLAATDANDNQAFLLNGGRVVGLQFHPEVTPALLELMVAEGRHELRVGGFIQSANTILNSGSYDAPGVVMRGVLDHLSGFV